MSDPRNDRLTDRLADDVPEPRQRRHRVSAIWLVPVLALIFGAWLVWKNVLDEGPEVTVIFESGAGLRPDETRVRYRDVDVGRVAEVGLSDDLSRVRATLRLAPEMRPFLREGTRFWIERPSLAPNQLSSLQTLVSGAWIGFEPVREGPTRYRFEGLAAPPLVTDGEAGRAFRLRSDALGALNQGSPLYDRQVRIGRVTDYELTDKGVLVDVFVAAPHAARIGTDARFWHASAFAVEFGADGLRVDAQTPLALLTGGIAVAPGDGARAPDGYDFPLHASREASLAAGPGLRQRYRLPFEHSVAGLERDAPVVFRGIRLGRVLEVGAEVDGAGRVTLPVIVELQPERLEITDDTAPEALVPALVAAGLRARLTPAGLLGSGARVELDLIAEPGSGVVTSDRDGSGAIPTLPVDPAPVRGLAAALSQTVNRLADLPLDRIGSDLAATAAALREVATSEDLANGVAALDDTLLAVRETVDAAGPDLVDAVDEARAAMASLRTLLESGSAERTEFGRLMVEMGEAARAVRSLADFLERQPESILTGRPASEESP